MLSIPVQQKTNKSISCGFVDGALRFSKSLNKKFPSKLAISKKSTSLLLDSEEHGIRPSLADLIACPLTYNSKQLRNNQIQYVCVMKYLLSCSINGAQELAPLPLPVYRQFRISLSHSLTHSYISFYHPLPTSAALIEIFKQTHQDSGPGAFDEFWLKFLVENMNLKAVLDSKYSESSNLSGGRAQCFHVLSHAVNYAKYMIKSLDQVLA